MKSFHAEVFEIIDRSNLTLDDKVEIENLFIKWQERIELSAIKDFLLKMKPGNRLKWKYSDQILIVGKKRNEYGDYYCYGIDDDEFIDGFF